MGADLRPGVLVGPGRPRQQLAEQRLRQALRDTSPATMALTTGMFADQAADEWSGFTGFPTILFDGRASFTEPGATPSLTAAARTGPPDHPPSTSSDGPTPRRPPPRRALDHQVRRHAPVQGRRPRRQWRLTSDITAMRTYREWVGLYGSNPSVVVRLIEEADGRQRVLKTWIALREVEGAGADATPPEANP